MDGKQKDQVPLVIPCLEDLSVIEQRCRRLGLAINFAHDVASTVNTRHVDDGNNAEEQSATGSDLFIDTYSKEYEVLRICDYKFEKGIDWYLIQWSGWSPNTNTWEPKKHLAHCQAKLNKFHRERAKSLLSPINGKLDRKRELEVDEAGLKKSKKVCEATATRSVPKSRLNVALDKFKPRPRPTLAKSNWPKLSANSPAKKELAAKLKAWQNEINLVCGQEAPIYVYNDVDLEGPPNDFVYINDYRAGEGIVIPDDPLVGCECAAGSTCYQSKDQCCGHISGAEFAYNYWRRLRITRGMPIFECNKRCKCGPDCANRVVQHGRKIKLAIFRTANDCGWGVRTLQPIKKDTFVTEYVGEVITNEEAEKRGKVYDAEGRTYLFDLDFDDGDCPYTVDAAHLGNISHFFNHSCEPNLVVYSVWINTIDPRLPRIAFFSSRDIAKGEELTFDYKMSGATSPSPSIDISGKTDQPPIVVDDGTLKRIPCKCKSEKCRKYLF